MASSHCGAALCWCLLRQLLRLGMLCCGVLLLCIRRMRAAWKAYEEHNLPLLRMEKPNLKSSQYR